MHKKKFFYKSDILKENIESYEKNIKKLPLFFFRTACITCVSFVCHSYCTGIPFVCHSFVLVCHLYVTRMYSYVIPMSLVCTRMPSLCHSYVLVCHSYVTCLWFYHESKSVDKIFCKRYFLIIPVKIPEAYISSHLLLL